MISIYYILLIMLLHWVFDFILQTSWMAQNKSVSFKALTAHTSLYSVLWIILFPILSWKVLTFILVTFVAHTSTDFVTSKITRKLWEKKDVHNFFVVIGLDQWLHCVQLMLTFLLLI